MARMPGISSIAHSQSVARPQHQSGFARASNISPKAFLTGELSDRMIDLGLIGVLCVSPLVMGGRHPMGQLVYVAIVSLMAIGWSIAQILKENAHWRRSSAEWVIFAGIILLGVQLLRLPESVLDSLSPYQKNLLPMWNGDSGGFGSWATISLYPSATRGALVVFIAHALVLLLSYQRIKTTRDVEFLLKLVAIAGTGIALLGLVQFLFSNGRFMWLYAHPSRDTSSVVKGPFSNANHFGHIMALSVGPLLWWIQRTFKQSKSAFGTRRPTGDEQLKRWALCLALGAVLFSCLLTYSRGAIIVFCVTTGCCLLLYRATQTIGNRALVALGLTLIGVIAAVSIHGQRLLIREAKSLQVSTVSELGAVSGRQPIWKAVGKAIPHFTILGSGAGTHREVYPIFFADYAEVEYTHAESGYLQILMETGVPGIVIVFAAILLVAFWSYRSLRFATSKETMSMAVATVAGCVASATHSIVDFVWYIPACISMTLVLVAIIARLSDFSSHEKRKSTDKAKLLVIEKQFCVACSVVVIAVCAMFVKDRAAPAFAASPWDSYLSLSLAARNQALHRTGQGRQSEHESVDRSEPETLRAMSELLTETIRKNPFDARAHLRLSSVLLQRFNAVQTTAENAMGLAQIRDAALASKFASRKSLDDWLKVAVGEHRQWLDMSRHHAKQGLRLCPLQGEAYLNLMETDFLSAHGSKRQDRLVEQALTTRPYDGRLLFAAGTQYAMQADSQKAIELWQNAYRRDPVMRRMITPQLASQMEATAFVMLFNPDTEGLGILFRTYRAIGREDQARIIAPTLVSALSKDAEVVGLEQGTQYLLEAAFVHAFMGDNDESVKASQQAVDLAPNDFKAHLVHAKGLLRVNRRDDFEEQIRWLQSRNRYDAELLSLIRFAEAPRATSTEPKNTLTR